MDFFHISGSCGAALFISLILRAGPAVVSISEGGTLTLRKCIRPQNEVAAQLLINWALCVVPGPSVFLADFGVVVFDSTLAEDQDGTGVGTNWRTATVPGGAPGVPTHVDCGPVGLAAPQHPDSGLTFTPSPLQVVTCPQKARLKSRTSSPWLVTAQYIVPPFLGGCPLSPICS